MTDQPGLTPGPPPEPTREPTGQPTRQPTSPPWGTAETHPSADPAGPAATPWPSYAPPAVPAYGVPPAYQQTTGQQTHQGGLWAMILGIVGLASAVLAIPTSGIAALGMVCSPVALGLGIWSSRQIRDRPDLYDNRGQAVAGWIMGLIGILLALLALFLVVAFVALIIGIFASVEQ